VLFAKVAPSGVTGLVRFDSSGGFNQIDSSNIPEFRRRFSGRTAYYAFWDSMTVTDTIRQPFIAGFYNLGNTCYFNATLHVLFAIRDFIQYFLSDECYAQSDLGREFHRLVTELMFGDHPCLLNGRLRYAMCADLPSYLQPDPQDSIDYFHYQMATIRRYLPSAPFDVIEFDTVAEIRCSSCHQPRIVEEKDVSLIVIAPQELGKDPQSDDIDDMIARAFQFTRSDCDCPSCHGRVAEVSKKIRRAPKYLFINNALDVGSRSPDLRYKRDLTLSLDPDELSLSKYVESGEAVYELAAFTHHFGKWAKWGHDVAYVREMDSWVKYDDRIASSVEAIKKTVVFGKQYLYLYRLKDPVH
jgi:uncharacterized UBP type Zn finger protein